ncbi:MULTISPECIES: hypothetical protein [Alkalimonas]|uniref:Lipoprotein n=1 Tax=Alkalimonas mucilaginosa TaxID=3057676 RepID=A0ABU7JI96_9GAMM|nr:hypothetical protein [Alkalimonas sp. MEB004]MEE2025422.1 hypothetical protein [Alkalimonas sp. MEB004]
MKKLCVVLLPLLLLIGCASTPVTEYVWVKDYERMQQIETSSRNSAVPNQLMWINPPMKKVPRAEWEQQHKQ